MASVWDTCHFRSANLHLGGRRSSCKPRLFRRNSKATVIGRNITVVSGICSFSSLVKKCSWLPSLPLRGSRSLQKPKEKADSSSRLLVGMTTSRVFQQVVRGTFDAEGKYCERDAVGA